MTTLDGDRRKPDYQSALDGLLRDALVRLQAERRLPRQRLRSCDSCGHAVAQNAIACPSCGHRYGTIPGVAAFMVQAITSAGIVGILAYVAWLVR